MIEKVSGNLGNKDHVFEVVYLGEKEDVLPFSLNRITSDKIIKIGDLKEFEWSFDTSFVFEEDLIFDTAKTKKFIDGCKKFFETKKQSRFIELVELWEKLQRS